MSDARLRRLAGDWLAHGRRAHLVEVLDAQGSTPREAGARMLVSADAVEGTIGGGHLELEAISVAREALRHGEHAVMERRFVLGPSLGQCCGGTVTLRIAPLDAERLAAWPLPHARFHLWLYGAGHVGQAIVRLLEGIDCEVVWIDEREGEFPEPAALPEQVTTVYSDRADDEVRDAAPGAWHLVLTHSHDLDLRIVEAVLRRGDFGFLGLIGSTTKRARFEHRLRERGIDEVLLQRLVCPIGIEGIVGKHPEVVAVSAVAQLLRLSSQPSQTATAGSSTDASST